MENPTHTLWETCLRTIRNNIAEDKFKTWFAPIQIVSYQENVLRFGLPNEFFHEYLVQHYGNLLYTVIKKVFGEDIRLEYCLISANTDKNNKPVVKHPEKEKVATESKKVTPAEETPRIDDLNSQLNYNYNFDNFIEGESNKLPRSVGQAIAEHPKQSTFNPLFIYGPSGVGKTHLVNAIGTKIKELHPTKRVLYVTSHLFQVQYTDSVRKNTVNDFINFYQTIDVLIIDDVQEFATLSKTQNTFFHIFNHLHLNGKQLVLTCDRPPVELEGIVPRLLTRFKWGLQTEVERPDYSLRRDILHNKIERDGLTISDDIVDYIARNVTDNVRDLEGTIVSLMAHAMAFNHDVTLDLAEQVVSRSVKMVKKQVTIDTVRNAVCTYYNMKPETLVTRSRKREIVVARQVAMYLTKKHTSMALAGIGSLLGRYDHATVLHACKTIEGQMQVDKELQKSLEEIEKLLVA